MNRNIFQITPNVQKARHVAGRIDGTGAGALKTSEE